MARVWIVLRGGQQFWPDEGRFDVSRQAARLFLSGRFEPGLRRVFGSADHLLFKLFALVPALAEQVFHAPLWVPGLFFAIVSTLVIYLICRVAVAAGASDGEAFLATVLAASTSSLFYYSRHFFPYDLSLVFFLAGILVWLSPPPRARTGAVIGFWVGLGFLTYNGYWCLGAVIVVMQSIVPWSGFRTNSLRAANCVVGFALPLLCVIGTGRLLAIDLVGSFVGFTSGANQGNFDIAWRFIPEYFWKTEHVIAVLWAVSIPMALVAAVFFKGSRRPLLWTGFAILLYLALVVPSDVVNTFTVSARQARVLAPFLDLACASMAGMLFTRGSGSRWVLAAVAVGIGVLGAIGFAKPLRQTFPDDFYAEAHAYIPQAYALDWGPYQIENTWFMHNPDWAAVAKPGDFPVLSSEHPFQYEPYLYEGYSEQARGQYRSRDLSMKLVRLGVGGARFTGYPGAIEMVLSFPEHPDALNPEPFVSSGDPGAADVIFFQYVDPKHDDSLIRIGHDDWGTGAVLSAPFRMDRAVPHSIVISMGSLYPAAADGGPGLDPSLEKLRKWLFVSIDGRVLLNSEREFHHKPSHTITLGMNLIGASSSGPELSARFLRVDRLGAKETTALINGNGERCPLLPVLAQCGRATRFSHGGPH